jgi:hypothetical protein
MLPKGEMSADKFGDRCRKLCHRIIRKVQDEIQRIIDEKAKSRLLATFIHGLKGVVGQQTQYQMPGTMEQAVRLAVTDNAEKHKQMVGGLRKVFASRMEFDCYRFNQLRHYARDCQQE